jgi:hypothetical protein
MEPLRRPLPAGEVPPGPYGPQEIVVYRLSDPVLVRRAGEATAYPLPVYAKRERLRSGGSVQCAAGGRCELLWPQDASSVVLFDEGWVDLGEPSRDEPLVTFRRVTRARLLLTPEDKIVLMGGAVLRGDPEEQSGPFLVERIRADLLAITNQSKRACTLAFRDAEILLSPGEMLRLPLLGAGGAPMLRDPAEAVIEIGGREIRTVGALAIDGTILTAGTGGARIQDGGIVLRLAEGESVRLEVFSAPSAAPEPLPEPDVVLPVVPPADPDALDPVPAAPDQPAAAEPAPPGETDAEAPAPAPPDDAAGEDPAPADDAAGEDPAPADDAAGEDPAPADDAAGEDPTPADDAEGDAPPPAPPDDDAEGAESDEPAPAPPEDASGDTEGDPEANPDGDDPDADGAQDDPPPPLLAASAAEPDPHHVDPGGETMHPDPRASAASSRSFLP